MSKQDVYDDMCRKCYIKIERPSKKEISKIVLTEYKSQCSCCKKMDYIVDYVEDYHD